MTLVEVMSESSQCDVSDTIYNLNSVYRMEFILATNNTVLPTKLECNEDSPNRYRDTLFMLGGGYRFTGFST